MNALDGLSQVHQLPAELTGAIFECCLCDQTEAITQNVETILAFSHVCHSWRASALSFKRLWRFIDLNRLRLAEEFLFRSHSELVHLSISIRHPWPYNHAAVLSQIKIHGARIHAFEASVAVIQTTVQLFELIKSCKHLSQLHFTNLAPVLLHDFDASSIRHLDIVNFAPRWETLANLTYLRLAWIKRPHFPLTRTFQAILRRSERLKVLELVDMGLKQNLAHLPADIVNMPCLTDLRIICTNNPFTSSNPAAIIRLLSFPKSTRIIIDFRYNSLPPILPQEKDQWNMQFGGNLTLALSKSFLGVSNRPLSRGYDIWTNFSMIIRTRESSVLDMLKHGLPFGIMVIRHLLVTGPWKYTVVLPRDWQVVFSIFGQLTRIDIDIEDNHCVARNIIIALTLLSPSGRRPCPFLRSLNLRLPQTFSTSATRDMLEVAKTVLKQRAHIDNSFLFQVCLNGDWKDVRDFFDEGKNL